MAMPMPRVIGISIACLVTSACVAAKTSERNTAYYPAASAGSTPNKAEMSPRGSPCAETYNLKQTDGRGSSFRVAACRDVPCLCCGQWRATRDSQFGKAAWYNLVGRKTASGEILDAVTATAANRSLPLGSFTKVTNLDNGRSVIVKINDRGPYTRGRIIDLSPRAAAALHMKMAGVAAVVVEPIVNQVDRLESVGDAMDTAIAP